MRGAIFRPGTTSSRGTLSLGELVDMYHARAATKKHDKVYALLGMSSDSPLLPDYKLPWSTVFQQVITYIFSEKASIRIWPHRDLALIQSRGHILGQVIEVKSDESQHDRHIVRIRNTTLQLVVTRRGDNRRTLYGRNMQGTIWILHVSAKPIQKGDIVCLLEGASKPSIIRPYKGYLSIIVTSATPLQEEEDVRWDENCRDSAFKTRPHTRYVSHLELGDIPHKSRKTARAGDPNGIKRYNTRNLGTGF